MAVLQDILYKAGIRSVTGRTDIEVTNVQTDSRKVTAGSLFIALKGMHSDGHQYLDTAIQQGAVALVVETLPGQLLETVSYVQVENTSKAAGWIAHNFYGQPSEKFQLVGVTGTNGKTTIATVLYKLFLALGYKVGLVSTVENRIGNEVIPSTHTTPDAVSLNALLKKMLDAGCSHVFMESSSHAIHQHRIEGLHYAGGIFSNITHDHLDYHKTFDEYIRVKKSFFDGLPSTAFALTNADDKRGMVMLQNTVAKKLTYSLRTMADFKGRILENNLTGLFMNINEQEVHFRLIGEFNDYNLLAVYGAAISLGEDKQEVLTQLSMLSGAEGRFDYLVSSRDRVIGIVDYAHTPDALLNVLATIKNLRKGHETVITVVGCGGDRDKTKRPIMAHIASSMSNKVIITSDNPRTEDPIDIVADMEKGVEPQNQKKTLSIVDRKQAIKTACQLAGPNDIILIAGKGHETYQEIQGVRHDFDDMKIVKELLEELGK